MAPGGVSDLLGNGQFGLPKYRTCSLNMSRFRSTMYVSDHMPASPGLLSELERLESLHCQEL